MMKAPERIWAFRTAEFISGIECGSWTASEVAKGSTEFVRADLSPSPEVVKELVEALRAIADEAYVTVRANDKGIDHKHLYEGWRKIATTRIDVARAALAKLEGGE